MTVPIAHEIFIEAPVDVVWRTITDPSQISQWFSDEADVALTPGYAGALTFTNKGGASEVAHITVHAIDPERSFSYRWAYEPGTVPAEGNSTLVEFTLTPEDGGTRLRVTETGVDLMDWPQERKDEFTADHNEGWAIHFAKIGPFAATKQSA